MLYVWCICPHFNIKGGYFLSNQEWITHTCSVQAGLRDNVILLVLVEFLERSAWTEVLGLTPHRSCTLAVQQVPWSAVAFTAAVNLSIGILCLWHRRNACSLQVNAVWLILCVHVSILKHITGSCRISAIPCNVGFCYVHLPVLQMLSSPICGSSFPSKHGVQVARSLQLMLINMWLPLEPGIAKWFERKYGVHPVSKQLWYVYFWTR